MTATPLNRFLRRQLHNRRPVRVCAGLLAASVAVPEAAMAQTPVTRSIPSNYSCYNTNAIAIDDWNTVDMTAFSQAAQQAGGQTLRVPGGDTANYWNWENYEYEPGKFSNYGDDGGIVHWYDYINQTPASREPNIYPFFLPQQLPDSIRYEYNTNATLGNVKRLIDGAQAEPIWVMNMTTSFLEKEIDHLKKAAALGMSVNRIELGNELYFSGGFNTPPGQFGNYERQDFGGAIPQVGGLELAEDYAAAAKTWADAVRVEFPNAEIALTGVTVEGNPSTRIQDWMPELMAAQGSDGRSAFDAVDAFTIHPYYNSSDIGITAADIGDRTRAGDIARSGMTKLRTILADSAIDPNYTVNGIQVNQELQGKKLWITEHNIIEPNDRVVVGNTWVGALMVDMHNHEFLKDARVDVSCAHVLTGNPQWQAIADEDGKVIDPNNRGTSNSFTDGTTARPHAQPFSQTATGFVLGKSADIFTDGTATLLHDGVASTAWRVENSTSDTISAINASDIDEFFELPLGKVWEVLTYIGDPWATIDGDEDLEIALEILTGGSLLKIPAFSKLIATADATLLGPQQPDGEEVIDPEADPEIVLEDDPTVPEPQAPGSEEAEAPVVLLPAQPEPTQPDPAQPVVSAPASPILPASPQPSLQPSDEEAKSVPEPSAILGLGLAAAGLAASRRRRWQKQPKFSSAA